MFSRFSVIAAVMALWAGVATAQEISRQVPVDADFWADDIRWTSGAIGYEFRWHVIHVGGRMEVCGVGVHTDMARRTAERELLRSATVLVNGQPILQDLTFFSAVRSVRRLNGAVANCRATGHPSPRGRYEVDLDFSDKSFRF